MFYNEVDFKNIVIKWFLCLFTYNFKFEVLLCFFDLIFSLGHKGIFLIALALFDLLEPIIRLQGDDLKP